MIKALFFILLLLFLLTMSMLSIYRENHRKLKITFEKFTIVNEKGKLENIWAYLADRKIDLRNNIYLYVYNEELDTITKQKINLNQLRDWEPTVTITKIYAD